MEFQIFHSTIPAKYLKDNKSKLIWTPETSDINSIIKHITTEYENVKISIEKTNFIDSKLIEDHNITLINTQSENYNLNRSNVWLYAQSDTLAHSLYNIAKNLVQVDFKFILPILKHENADKFLAQHNQTFEIFSIIKLTREEPDIVIMLNDWSKEARWLISLCRLMKIPTICIQESIIDFGDHFKRMEHADFVFLQGTQTLFELKRNLYFITGNPRYETIKRIQPKSNKHAVLNCNFTYNINEEIREQWLNDIIDSANKSGFDYSISQHPRDHGNLSSYKNVFKSNSASVHQLMANTSVLVTRFSSLIHEAIIMGLPVIYYNPHDEKMHYDFNFNNEFLFLAKNKNDLKIFFEKVSNGVDFSNRESYLAKHCILPQSVPSSVIKNLIISQNFLTKKMSIKDYFLLIFYHPYILKIIFYIRKLLN